MRRPTRTEALFTSDRSWLSTSAPPGSLYPSRLVHRISFDLRVRAFSSSTTSSRMRSTSLLLWLMNTLKSDLLFLIGATRNLLIDRPRQADYVSQASYMPGGDRVYKHCGLRRSRATTAFVSMGQSSSSIREDGYAAGGAGQVAVTGDRSHGQSGRRFANFPQGSSSNGRTTLPAPQPRRTTVGCAVSRRPRERWRRCSEMQFDRDCLKMLGSAGGPGQLVAIPSPQRVRCVCAPWRQGRGCLAEPAFDDHPLSTASRV